MFDVVVANGRFFGGGMKMCPDAEPDDGLLDVVTIGDVTKRDLVLTMPKIYRGTHLPHPKAEALRGRVVTVETDEPVPVELDGEQPGNDPGAVRGAAGGVAPAGAGGDLSGRELLRRVEDADAGPVTSVSAAAVSERPSLASAPA